MGGEEIDCLRLSILSKPEFLLYQAMNDMSALVPHSSEQFLYAYACF
jgi:hypothetical protein